MKAILATSVIVMSAPAFAGDVATSYFGDVHPGFFNGTGVSNGSFTVGTDVGHNVEVGLRAKVRWDSNNQPQNQFNYNSATNTYTMQAGNPDPAGLPAWKQEMARWNFEFSINTDVQGSTSKVLSDFTYQLEMYQVNADGTMIGDALTWDPINGADPRNGIVGYDHSFGDNTFDDDSVALVAGSEMDYQGLISSKNVVQQSWNYSFFDGLSGTALENWNASDLGTYIIRLTMFDAMSGDAVATSQITVNVVPLPTAAFAGLGLMAGLAGVRTIRRR